MGGDITQQKTCTLYAGFLFPCKVFQNRAIISYGEPAGTFRELFLGWAGEANDQFIKLCIDDPGSE